MLAGSLLAYAACLTLPAYIAGSQEMRGFLALFLGIFGLASGQYAWLANFTLLGAGLALKSGWARVSVCLSMISLALGLSFLLKDTVQINGGGDYPHVPFQVLSGYYFWLSSMSFAAAAALIKLSASPADILERPTRP